MSKSQRLQARLDFGAGAKPLLLGELLWVRSQGVAAFEWSQEALDSGFLLSPFMMPLAKGVNYGRHEPFGGLHCLFADSIPDGFGLGLMNRSIASSGLSLDEVTPLDRLAWIGDRGLGALTYRPAIEAEDSRALMDIAELGMHAARADIENFKDIPKAAINAGGSAMGVRPKFWAAVSEDGSKILLGDSPKTPAGFSACLVKFAPARGDKNEPFYEAACLELASKYGVPAARGRLLYNPHGVALAIERFDRTPSGGRMLVQSLASLLGDDYRVPKLDYKHLVQASAQLTDEPEAERIFRQACFNVALSIRDDHSKNFAFLMNAEGKWELSPAFDLCPSHGPSGWHNMTISGAGNGVGRSHLLKFAQSLGLPEATAKDGIDQALAASSEFEALAIDLGSQKAGVKKWAQTFKSIAKELSPVSVALELSEAAMDPQHEKEN